MRTLPLVSLISLLSLSVACRTEGDTKFVVDRDEDGLSEDEDCDDNDPGAGAAQTYYYDNDLDGHGDPAMGEQFCDRPEGYSEAGDDCDDASNAVYPGADDVCDEIDNDCDGIVDNGLESVAYYTDADGDGYGDDTSVVYDCSQPEGTATESGDCNDADAAYNPGALEEDCEDPADYNCDGSTGYADADGDGFAACTECNDADAAVNPSATEVCNNADDDCDSLVDDADDSLDLSTTTVWYADLDGDGFGDPASPANLCDPGVGWVADNTDCDDLRSDINPTASEVCNGLDDDCDGAIDDADDSLDVSTGGTFYSDTDGDGYGSDSAALSACETPSGYSALGGDCDDADTAYNPGALEDDCSDPNDYNCDGSVGFADADGDGYAACEECDDANAANNPAATELCDGSDNDCDGTVDEADAADASVWYADADGDGYGGTTTTAACDAPSGYVSTSTDCDDGASVVNPAATELCNGVDDDCDGSTDEDASADAATWYADTDGDGYGDAGNTTESCAAPSGYIADSSDCNDLDADVNPSAIELCNGIDDDCNGAVDEDASADAATWYADTDGDGYGDAASSTVDCSMPAGYTADSSDCDDTESGINPAASESCDGIDEDCDGVIDNDATDVSTWYSDADGDGYGDAGSSTTACDAPAGSVANSSDCNDADATINPAATESCDGVDEDCDGSIDDGVATSTWYADVDADGYGDASDSVTDCAAPSGYVAISTDCNDADASIRPGATEVCDDIDQDCDGTADDGLATTTYYADDDGDGFGDLAVADCSRPPDVVDNDFDCDDTDASVIPGGHEDCAWPSCLELLDDGIASTDGDYWIDFAGTATETECDMTTDGGGWTLVYAEDFSASASGWSTTTTTSCGTWGTILGGYGVIAYGEMSVTASTYSISHTEVWGEVTYIALDSWDGETAYVELDGTTIWSQATNNHSSSYAEVCGWNRGYYGSYDSRWPVSESIAHTAGSVEVLGGSTLNQAATDESFGLDDVYVWVR